MPRRRHMRRRRQREWLTGRTKAPGRLASSRTFTALTPECNASRCFRLLPRWRRRYRVPKARPRGKAVKVGRERLRRRYGGSRFRKVPEVGENRHHVNVGKREAITRQEAAF